MAGVTTDVCLVFPALSAVADGYNVQAVMDASDSPYELSEEMSRRRMQDAGVVLTAANTVMAELAQDWSSPEGQQLVQLLFTEVLPRWPPDRGRGVCARTRRARACGALFDDEPERVRVAGARHEHLRRL